MTSKITTTLFLLTLSILFVSCEKNFQSSGTKEGDLARLSELRSEILALSESVSCQDPTSWKFMAMGEKPCGGPAEYVLYSKEIDTRTFTKKVEAYTTLNKNINKTWGFFSDCALVQPPSGIKCVNGKATPVYDVASTTIVGTWKLKEILADPGDGSGKYTPVTGPAKHISFEADGKVTGNFSPDFSAFKILDQKRIEFTSPQKSPMTYRYNQSGDQLELIPPCIEACGLKFTRVMFR